MKRLILVALICVILFPLIPRSVYASEARVSLARTVWENAYTLTTFHEDGKINKTIFSFPKVIWDGSQWVDYILNASDMSGGIGSIYIKVLPSSTVIYDPERTEERVRDELWVAEYYDASTHEWKIDNPIDNEVIYSVNSSGLYFTRKSTLHSNSILETCYALRKGSKLKISVLFKSACYGKYRLVWKLMGIYGTRVRWLNASENIFTTIKIGREPCSWAQFISDNISKCSLNWWDTYWFNKTSGRRETSFLGFEVWPDASLGYVNARVMFGNFTLSRGEYAYLDPSIMTFNSEVGLDGYIEKYGPYYPPDSGSNLVTGADFIVIGQEGKTYGGLNYHQWRSYVSFDTSSVPSLAYNLSAQLCLKTKSDYSDVDFSVKIMGGNQPLYGSGLEVSDWGCGESEVNAWNTVNYPGDGVYINLTISPDQINKVGRTQFELKSSREGYVPSRGALESIYFYSGDSTGNGPKLEVAYYVDVVNINGTNWYYRNVSSDKAVIVLFGGMQVPKPFGSDPSTGSVFRQMTHQKRLNLK